MTELSITVPFAKIFSDYHDIEYFLEDLQSIPGFEDLKCLEASSPSSSSNVYVYWGVYYIGLRPTRAQIKQLIEDNDY